MSQLIEMSTLNFGDGKTYEIVDKKAREEVGKKISSTDKGKANGVASLDKDGKIPEEQLPEVTANVELGETEDKAYPGNKGKIAYDHAQLKGKAFVSGLYKITTNKEGHVTSVTPVTKKDITVLGIPEEDTDTTYESEGEGSFATNYGALAIGEYSFASGKNTVAGYKGFHMIGYSKSSDNLSVDITVRDLNLEEKASDNYVIGDLVNIEANNHLHQRYKIIRISKDETSNTIITLVEVDGNAIGFSLDGGGEDEDWLYVVGKCVGEPIPQFVGATAFGLDNIVAGYGGFVCGRNNQACGNYAFASGRNNIAAHAGFVTGRNNEATGLFASALGLYNRALGDRSLAFGNLCVAKGAESLAGGYISQVYADRSTALGNKCIVNGENGFACGLGTTVNGKNGFACGLGTTVNGENGFACGLGTTVNGKNGFACGSGTKVNGENGFACGLDTQAGLHSFAEGVNTNAYAWYCHAAGKDTIAYGNGSYAGGLGTIADCDNQYVIGKYNQRDTDRKYSFIVGNGSSDTDRRNAHSIDWQGNAWYKGSVTSNGADYAEYFEWLDGNTDNEDRVGLLVTLDGEKIRLANTGDEILGIISGTAAVLGDNYECEWNGKYLTDDFGRVIYDMVEEFIDVEHVEFKEVEKEIIDDKTNETRTEIVTEEVVTVEKISTGFWKHPRINPDYDPEQPYINRSDRPEWDTVGMLGKLYVRDDGTCQVNGYATVGENGIATVSSEKTNMRVLSRVNENIVRVLMK